MHFIKIPTHLMQHAEKTIIANRVEMVFLGKFWWSR